jgi:hypothetical protein
MQGFAGSVLGAIATVLAAFVAQAYAARAANETAPTASLPRSAAAIVKLLNSFEISEAKRFSVAYFSSYAHAHLDLIVAIGSTPRSEKMFAGSDTYLNLILPGMSVAERHSSIEVGWTRVFVYAASAYRLTLLEESTKCTFELRKLPQPNASSTTNGGDQHHDGAA